MKPKDKKIRFGKLVHLGCIVCKELGFGWTPPEIHHLKGYQFSSMGKRAQDEYTIPLCYYHHRTGGGSEVGYHQSPAEFERRYGTQAELLELVDELIYKN